MTDELFNNLEIYKENIENEAHIAVERFCNMKLDVTLLQQVFLTYTNDEGRIDRKDIKLGTEEIIVFEDKNGDKLVNYGYNCGSVDYVSVAFEIKNNKVVVYAIDNYTHDFDGSDNIKLLNKLMSYDEYRLGSNVTTLNEMCDKIEQNYERICKKLINSKNKDENEEIQSYSGDELKTFRQHYILDRENVISAKVIEHNDEYTVLDVKTFDGDSDGLYKVFGNNSSDLKAYLT